PQVRQEVKCVRCYRPAGDPGPGAPCLAAPNVGILAVGTPEPKFPRPSAVILFPTISETARRSPAHVPRSDCWRRRQAEACKERESPLCFVYVPQSRSRARSVGKDKFVSVPQSRDVFKSPQGCSGTHPVGKDESSRSVGKDKTQNDNRGKIVGRRKGRPPAVRAISR